MTRAGSKRSAFIEQIADCWWALLFVYILVAMTVYSETLFRLTFFWEDFWIVSYPLRDFSFSATVLSHTLPHWNPYSLAWCDFLADPQTGFWYPANILQIAFTGLTFPEATHLPVLVSEAAVIMHAPIAALGMAILCRRCYGASPLAAALGGLCFGFGARFIAEQNHPMLVYQLALLPWIIHALHRAWHTYRGMALLAILLSLAFFAGQQQLFLYTCLFIASSTCYEVVVRLRSTRQVIPSLAPIGFVSLSILLTVGITAIQLLPSLQHTSLSLRQHLSFSEASVGSVHPIRLILFLAPKFFGEVLSASSAHGAVAHNQMWYWEGVFYWGIIPEALAAFAAVYSWRTVRNGQFLLGFGAFAVLFAFGSYTPIYWLFWKWIPMFDHIRMPSRMLYFVWLIGCLFSARGFDLLLNVRIRRVAVQYLIGALSVVAVVQLFAWGVGYFWAAGRDLTYLAPESVLAWVCSLVVVTLLANRKSRKPKTVFILLALAIAADLLPLDANWYHSASNPQQAFGRLERAEIFSGSGLHSGISWPRIIVQLDSTKTMLRNAATYLRMPVQTTVDSNALLVENPARLVSLVPPIKDSIRRMHLLGICAASLDGGISYDRKQALPLVRVFDRWEVAHNDAELRNKLNDTLINVESVLVIDKYAGPRGIPIKTLRTKDTAIVQRVGLDEVRVRVYSSVPGITFVNIPFHPNWTAQVNGKPVRVSRAFGSLMAVPVGQGISILEMTYVNRYFDVGWKISISALLLAAFILCYPRGIYLRLRTS